MQDLLASIRSQVKGDFQVLEDSSAGGHDNEDDENLGAPSTAVKASSASMDGSHDAAATAITSSSMGDSSAPALEEKTEIELPENTEPAQLQTRSEVSGEYEDLDEEDMEEELQQQADEGENLDDSGFFEEEILEDSEVSGVFEEEYVIEDGDPDVRLEGIMEETATILREQGEDVPSVHSPQPTPYRYQETEQEPAAPMQDVEVKRFGDGGSDAQSVQSALSLGTTEVKSMANHSVAQSTTASEAAFQAADHLLSPSQQNHEPLSTQPLYQQSPLQAEDASRQSSRKSGSVRSAAEVASAVGLTTPLEQSQGDISAGYNIRHPSDNYEPYNANSNISADPNAINMRLDRRPAREPMGHVVKGPPSHRYGDDPAKLNEIKPTPPIRPPPQQQQYSMAPGVRVQQEGGPSMQVASSSIDNSAGPSQHQQTAVRSGEKVHPDPKATSSADVGVDIETGNKKDAERSSSQGYQAGNETTTNKSTLKVMLGLIVLVVIVLAIALPLALRDDDDNGDREIETTPIPAPLPIPSPAPTSTIVSWQAIFPTVGGPRGSAFGSAVALDGEVLVVGAPQHSGTGAFFSSVNTGSSWGLQAPITGPETGSGFGTAIDLLDGQMIVGAPNVKIANSEAESGAAYYYAFNSSSNQWDATGPELRGDQDLLAAGGYFGSAVALSKADLPRVAIGAPRSALDMATYETGRVHTYEGTGSAWNTLETSPLVGQAANDWFGAALDMTEDGSLLIVGAPGKSGEGKNGYFRIYGWTGTSWNMEYEIAGEDAEGLGSTVVALSDSIFAVGAPGSANGRGRIALYERSGPGKYAWIAQVEGGTDERIGRANTVTGSVVSSTELLLIVATQTGDVVTYQYKDGSISDTKPVQTLVTGYPDLVVDHSGEGLLVTGTAQDDSVFVLEVSSPLPAKAPAAAPSTMFADSTQAPTPATFVDPFVPPSPITTNTTTTATGAPTGSPSVEQVPATDATNSSSMGWSLVANSFQPKVDGANFGTSVSLASSRLAVGGPFTLGNGAALVYQKINGVWETTASGQLFGESEGDEFGAALDVTDRLLCVGAPKVKVEGTLTKAGAAYCYISNGGAWQKLGPTLRGDTTVQGANELFGMAMAASTNGVVIVGAPGSALGTEVGSQGRVYVFEFDDAATQWTMVLDLFARVPNVELGSAVDIARDGSHIVVGARGSSGSQGYVEIYQRNGTEFALARVLRSTKEEDGFGTSVAVISPSGETIAVGAPDDLNGRGRVYVYQKNFAGAYVTVGDPIVGETGERLGELIAGESSSPRVFLGTAQGKVKQFSYDPGLATWVSEGAVDTGLGSDLQALAVSSQSQAFVAGGNNDAAIYEPPSVVR